MVFNILDPMIFLIFYQHFSSDTIQSERMMRERRQEELYQLVEGPASSSSAGVVRERCKLNSLVAKMNHLIKYNNFCYYKFAFFILHLLTLAFIFIVAVSFTAFPLTRHPKTGEFLHPLLRAIELCYITDVFKHQSSTLDLNRTLALILASSLVAKSVAFRSHLRRAQQNRYHYRKISFVHMNIAYLKTLYYDRREWFHLSLCWITHPCKIGTELRQRMSKRALRMLTRSSKINRMYYHNPIDFTCCLDEFHAKHQCRNTQRRPTNLFVPNPAHRLCTRSISAILLIYYLTVGCFALILFLISIVFLINHHHDRKHTAPPAMRTLAHSYLLQSIVTATILAIDGFEGILCLWSGVICYSRVLGVKELIKWEVNFQRHHFRLFAQQLAHKEAQLCESFQISSGATSESKFLLTDQHFYQLAEGYKESLDKRLIRERNDSLRYIIHLVEVLLSELQDTKKAFSACMNSMFFFGVFGATIMFSVFWKIKNERELLFAFVFMALSALPILLCGIQAALVEWAFCKICKQLYCLMANGLHLIDLELIMEFNKLLDHLTDINNRSFVLFANFAITFRSIFTVLGWIANAYPLLVSTGFLT